MNNVNAFLEKSKQLLVCLIKSWIYKTWCYFGKIATSLFLNVKQFLQKTKTLLKACWRWLVDVAPRLTIFAKLIIALINLSTTLKPYGPKIARILHIIFILVFADNHD